MYEIIKKEQVFKTETSTTRFFQGQRVLYRNQVTKIKNIINSPLRGSSYELATASRFDRGLLIVSESELRPYSR